MALSSILIPPDEKRDAKARELVKTVHTWHHVTLRQAWGAFPAGTVCRQTRNGYYVNAVLCTCPDYAEWQHICKHVRAYVIWEAEQKQTEAPVIPHNFHWYHPDYAACLNCNRTRSAYTKDEPCPQKPASFLDYRAMYPGCAGGCGQIVDSSTQRFCDDCGAARERQERLAAARRRVVESWM